MTRGRTAAIALPSPPTGQWLYVVVPGAVEWTLLGLSFDLVNAVAAANRQPFLSIEDTEGRPFFQSAPPFHTTSGVTSRISYGVGIQQFGANDAAKIGASIPPIRLYAGLVIVAAVDNMNAGDRIRVAGMLVEQWPVRE